MRFRILAITFLALACSGSLAPGDYLVGAWSGGRQAITAARTGAVLDTPCIEVSFAPILLDDSLAFHVTGTVTIAVGLVTRSPRRFVAARGSSGRGPADSGHGHAVSGSRVPARVQRVAV